MSVLLKSIEGFTAKTPLGTGVISIPQGEQHIFQEPIQIAIPKLYIYAYTGFNNGMRVSVRLHYSAKTTQEIAKVRLEQEQMTTGTVQTNERRNQCIC